MGWISSPKKYLINITIVLIATLIGLLAMEILTRVFVDELYWKYRDATDDWLIDDKIGWRLKPNLNVTSTTYDGRIILFKTNQDGVQTSGYPSAELRILIIGDSTVVGRGVSSETRIQNYLVKYLKEYLGRDSYIINAGVGAYSTDQSLLQLRGLITKYKPTFVLHSITYNDFMQNQTHIGIGVKINKPKFDLLEGQLWLQPSPEKTESISRLGSGLKLAVQYSALYRMIRLPLQEFRIKYGLMITTVFNFESGVGKSSEDFNEYLKDVDWDLFAALLLEMRRETEENNAEFIAWKHPHIEEVWPAYRNALGLSESQAQQLEDKILSITKDNHIFYLPVNPHFMANQHLGPFHLLPRDPHANARGYELQADVIAKYISERMKK